MAGRSCLVSWMKWIAVSVFILANAIFAVPHFILRLNRDAAGGSVFSPAYAAPWWVAALLTIASLAIAVGLVLGRARRRWRYATALPLVLAATALSLRSVEYDFDGEFMERAYPYYARRIESLPASEHHCFVLLEFDVALVDTQHNERRLVFRGIWPMRFESREMSRILLPCETFPDGTLVPPRL